MSAVTHAPVAAGPAGERRGARRRRSALRRAGARPGGGGGRAAAGAVVLAALFAPWVAPYDPYYTDLPR